MKKILLSILLLCYHVAKAQQYVGINTPSPLERLHVAGNIKADTIKPRVLKITQEAGMGKILVSDASGNASWQNNNNSETSGQNAGFGVWGDCATNGNIAAYNPAADIDGKNFDLCGWSVAISGNYAIAGARDDDVDDAGGLNSKEGSASIFRYDGSNWVFMQKLSDTAAQVFDMFGYSVSVSDNYAVIGIPGNDTGKGAVNIYERTPSGWIFTQKLTAANGNIQDNFGKSVSISGNIIVVGISSDDVGQNANQGSANIYTYNGTRWVLMQKITDNTGAADDNFGISVSVSGSYIMVGASHDDVSANIDQGSASIYKFDGTAWVLMQKITDATGASMDNFGNAVCISGIHAIAGAVFDDVGSNSAQGSASIYEYKNNTWTAMQKITRMGGVPNDNFGCSVSIAGNLAVVGTYPGSIPTSNSGHANIYVRVGRSWGHLQQVSDPMGNAADGFGYATAIDESSKRFIIGAPFYATNSGKVVFGKTN